MKPMPLFRSLLFFGIPALFMFAWFWYAIPLLDWMGNPLFVSVLLGFSIPYLLLFLASLFFFRKERNSWKQLAERFRFKAPLTRDWLATASLVAFGILCFRLLSPLSQWLQLHWIAPPKFFLRMLENDSYYFMEVPVSGNWIVPAGLVILFLIKAVAEEFWWRGYILPRQELAFGDKAWLIHGFLWAGFYLFMPWALPWLLPVAFALAYLTQKLRNTWPATIAHFAVTIPPTLTVLWKVIAKN